MAATPSEGRALSAALSAPVPFRTRAGEGLLHTADRHVGRLAADEGPQRPRGLGTLAFVDRLVVPWVMAAQQSASLRLFGEYIASGPGQRAPGHVSWVFPRPWYQDELDWMAAAREGAGAGAGGVGAQGLFTTRGTFEQRRAAAAAAAPSALEYVAPSMAQPVDAARAWSPLYGADAMARAQLMQVAVDASGGGAGRQLATTALAAMAPAMVGSGASTQAIAASTGQAGSVPALRARLAALVAATDGGAAQAQTSRLVGQVPAMVMPAVVADGFGDDAGTARGSAATGDAGPGYAASARAIGGSARAEEAARIDEAARSAEGARVEAARGELARIQAAREAARIESARSDVARTEAARADAARTEAARSEAARTEAARSEAARVEAARAEAARVATARGGAGAGADPARAAEAARAIEAARSAEAARAAEAAARGAEAARGTEAARGADAARAGTTPSRPEDIAAMAAAREAAQRQAEADARERVAVARVADVERAQQAHRHAEAQRAAIDAQRAIMLQMEQAQRAASTQRAELAQAQAAQAQTAQAQAALAQTAQPSATAGTEAAAMPVGLKMVELLARGLEAGRAPAPIAGPRVALPAGLGGLVAATGPATALGAMSAGRSLPIGAWLPPPAVVTTTAADAGRGDAPRAQAPSRAAFALPAVAQARPQVLEHVAWADRWLGRMAGAQPRALAAFDSATDPAAIASARAMSTRASVRASVAPMPVFVAPADLDGVSPADAAAAMAAQAEVRAARPEPAAQNVVRFDDGDETPDDVFFAIAAARAADAGRGRSAAASTAPARAAAAAAAASTATRASTPSAPIDRMTPADAVLTSVPLAPGAGFAPGLAASPIAPALASLLPLPPAAAFDVRALFGTEVASAYLGGLLSASAFAVDEHGELAASGSPLAAFGGISSLGRFAPAAFAPSARAAAAPAMDVVAPLDLDLGPDVDTQYYAAAMARTGRAGAMAYDAPAASEVATLRPALLLPQPDYATATAESIEWSSAVGAHASAAAIASLPGHYPLPDDADAGGTSATAASSEPAWTSGAGASAPLWSSRPGMTAERSRRWAAHTQHAAADLALDFVSPELVLAARVYGLSPADAAQATRLATGGPTALQVLAGQVELTFLRALAADAELRGDGAGPAMFAASAERRAAAAAAAGITGADVDLIPTAAYPIGDGASAPSAMATTAAMASTTAPTTSALASALPATSRRTPRGAFLWPAATVGAIGMHAPAPDGDGALSIAALELLAAGAVAQLGTYAIQHGATAEEAAQLIMARGGVGLTLPAIAAATATGVPGMAPMSAGATATAGAPTAPGAMIDPTESDAVAMAAVTTLATPDRARFQALYVALTQSAAGRELSPVARAARALAMTARSDDAAALSTRDRAALAWSMMPVVEASAMSPEVIAALTSAGFDATAIARGAAPAVASTAASAAPSTWSMRAPDLTALSVSASAAAGPGYADDVVHGDLRPGLAPLSHRAGEALSSFVTPLPSTTLAAAPGAAGFTAATTGSSAPASMPPAARAPSQEIVKAISSRGRYGGGEVEIPPWFEQAARKMLEDRGGGDGLSLADLTLVTAAPQTHIAASTRGPSSAASSVPAVSTVPAKPGMPDIEKLAQEVYAEVLAMLRHAHERNSGDV